MKKLIILIFAVAFLSWCEAVPEYQYSIDYTKIDWTTGSITCVSILIPYIREGKSILTDEGGGLWYVGLLWH